MLSGIAMACADTTSPVAPAVEQVAVQLPSLTWQGADGPRTATLLGTDILFENGTRIAIDTATAKNFRRLAISMPKMEALAKRMAPVWAKMGLPTPTSGPQARVALAALRTESVRAMELAGVLTPTSPIAKPTLVAECDPTMQFCGFDTGTDPNGGGMGGSGGAGTGGAGPCERIGLTLYQSIAQWRAAAALCDQVLRETAACQQINGPSWPTMCRSETLRLSDAMFQLSISTYQMETVAQILRAYGCI
jgi:hypothetical protein